MRNTFIFKRTYFAKELTMYIHLLICPNLLVDLALKHILCLCHGSEISLLLIKKYFV